MKNQITIIIIAAFLIFPFCQSSDCEKENEELRAQMAEYIEQVERKNILITQFNDKIVRYDQSLDSIRILENQIDSLTEVMRYRGRVAVNENELINEMMQKINRMLAENESLAEELQHDLDSANYRSGGYNKIVEVLAENLKDKQAQIRLLEQKVKSLESEVSGLKVEVKRAIDERDIAVEEAEHIADSLNETKTKLKQAKYNVYYLIGTKDDLVKKNIIITRGLLNRIAGLSSTFDASHFKPINYKNVSLITISPGVIKPRNIELVPQRRPEDFEIRNVDGRVLLKISNPESFWKISKYLVIVIK